MILALLIYYLARGRQFVRAYALSMLSVANHILIIIKFHNLCVHDIIFQSVVYRHVFTHNRYVSSSSVRLIADCERLTKEAQHCVCHCLLPGIHPSRYLCTLCCLTSIASTQLFSHSATGTRLKGSGWVLPDNRITSICHYASQINPQLVMGKTEAS